ncbi:hypothetical protein BJY52DRAFT_1245633 [Lactarius psammicola]|nr:hypothetical protein BJY52DRAFT_1245633 [Lactarius psammicola]
MSVFVEPVVIFLQCWIAFQLAMTAPRRATLYSTMSLRVMFLVMILSLWTTMVEMIGSRLLIKQNAATISERTACGKGLFLCIWNVQYRYDYALPPSIG